MPAPTNTSLLSTLARRLNAFFSLLTPAPISSGCQPRLWRCELSTQGNTAELLMGLEYLLSISYVDDTEVSKDKKVEDMTGNQKPFLKKVVKDVLVKLGGRGSALFTEGKEPIIQSIIEAKKVIDTTGAGDTFAAAYAVAFIEGKSKVQCLKFAGERNFRDWEAGIHRILRLIS
ncbi:hypothetical protein L2E82_39242 [Cichorium intybus]|uniref:Uncharacterized protein n=1 Tax=Cichorium intybus TaxID=13427 RepID=A0ACB9AM20_CICIN|nr:hypothetical protein L2E82_39242 [Cichorium intybus]